jgi:serine/threonine protein kinase
VTLSSLAAPNPPADAALPQRIGKYRVLARLGEGTTSEVFLAHDDFNDRPVAIKRVRLGAAPGVSDSQLMARFFDAEAALVGRLQHPNVVQIYDAVSDPAGPYVVMQYVPGTTLRSFCRADALLPLDQVVEIGFKCAMALGYVSRQGLIHRDVKPANLLVTVQDGMVTDVKVSDFGSALNLQSDATQVLGVGSLAYMPPEQLDGGTLDASADIYGLGAVLYHLIAGHPPFEATTTSVLMAQICTAEPASLVGERAGVDPALDAVVRRSLAKRPQDRHPDWDSFARALSALVTNQQVPLGAPQDVLDSERFTLLRSLEFFGGFGDVELWEVVRRADWQRHPVGHRLYRSGEEGNTFHIIAAGAVEVNRDGRVVARLSTGTSVGEMAYLAPNPEFKRHSTDVVVVEPATTISFTPQTMARLSPDGRHLFDEAFIRVLVRRLHVAHEALAHPRRIL